MNCADRLALVLLFAGGAASMAGCGGPSQAELAQQKQDAALKDPFGYSPDLRKSDDTVSGNSEFDKDAFKRDLDHVINP